MDAWTADTVSASTAAAGGPPVRRRWAWGWTVGGLMIAAVVMVPLMAVAGLAMGSSDDIWSHLASTVLPHYVRTTLLLITGVGVGTLVIGAGTAWLVTMYRVPGRGIFEWALLLPLAVPAYVIAYVYTDVLEYAGPVQGLLRATFGWTSAADYWFPEIRSLGGAVAMMSLVLYPYVYLLARAAFIDQSVCALEVGRTLGAGPWRNFRRIALPLARPAVAVGVSLALMEALNDFGTVDYFAVATFTAGIYDVWLNMNSTAGAAQLASVLLLFVLALVVVERMARRQRRFHHMSTRYRTLPCHPLSPTGRWLAFAACLLPLLLGFVVPASLLLVYTLETTATGATASFLGYAANSVLLSGSAAGIAVIVGLILAYGVRLHENPALRVATRIAGVGYAVPGAVLAIGVLVPMAAFDNAVDGLARQYLGVSTGLLLSGTVVVVVFGYVARFLALSLGSVEAGLARITPAMDDVARTLGCAPAATLRRVHLPMMKGSIATAALLVFVDGMKELPMTMLLRPFNFDTLATYVHQLASDELLEECAPGALLIVLVGVLPVILLSRTIRRARPGAVEE